jgi:hypothetical protein
VVTNTQIKKEITKYLENLKLKEYFYKFKKLYTFSNLICLKLNEFLINI